MPVLPVLADGFLDLVLGSSCVVCAHPGRSLCPRCRAELPRDAAPRWPTPTPPGMVAPYATGDYEGPLRALVLAHKERRVLALARPLGTLLACAVAAALAEAEIGAGDPVVLVPVPSRRSAVRQRGHDPTQTMTSAAAAWLNRGVGQVDTARLLRLRPGVLDQAGLDTRARAANLAGSMAVPSDAVRRLARRRPRAVVIVCDDVLTTGATLREAQRALAAAGVPVLAAATVAATRRRIATPRSEMPLLPTPVTD